MKKMWMMIGAALLITLASCQSAGSKDQTGSAAKSNEALNFVKDMGVGWNLGNTLEACGDWINKSSIRNFETAWGAPYTTKEMFTGLRAAGIKSVRIPVAWSNLMGPDYTINPHLMNRVSEVVGWALDADLYVILNLHWDGGWIAKFSTDYDESMKRYVRIWTQVTERFKDAPDHLILESLNEEACFNDLWNRWGGTSGKDKAYQVTNNINQKFVDIVRASGGSNASRFLLIAGYATDIDLTCDELFCMPKDTAANRLIVSVHYYTPSTFTILEKDADWGKMAENWGTDVERDQVWNDFTKMETRFIKAGIPVIIGEYGTVTKNKNPNSVYAYLTTVAAAAYELGMCPMLWDCSVFYDRTSQTFKPNELGNFYLKLSQKKR